MLRRSGIELETRGIFRRDTLGRLIRTLRTALPPRLLKKGLAASYFSLALGDESSIHRLVRSWYISSMATGLIPLTHGWWAITALL